MGVSPSVPYMDKGEVFQSCKHFPELPDVFTGGKEPWEAPGNKWLTVHAMRHGSCCTHMARPCLWGPNSRLTHQLASVLDRQAFA